MGPSCLIGPVICFFEKYFIKGFPIKKIIIRDVTTDNPILKVMYLNTFKKYLPRKLKNYKAFVVPPKNFLDISCNLVALEPLIIKKSPFLKTLEIL